MSNGNIYSIVTFKLFPPLWRKTTLEYCQINLKHIVKNNILKYQPVFKMCDYLLIGKYIQIREKHFNHQGVMTKDACLTSVIRTCVMTKANANLSSSLTRRENFSQILGTPEYLFHKKNILMESRHRNSQSRF